MKYLFTKTRRDIIKMWTQFFSVFMMAFLGIFIYSGIEGAWNGAQTQMNQYFEDTNLADAWVYGQGITSDEIDKVKQINGVKEINSSMSTIAKVVTQNNDHPELKIVATDENDISKPYISKGEEFSQNTDGIWLSKDFAKERNILVGDKIKLNIAGKDVELQVKALILHPEFTYYSGSTMSLMPNPSKYGYALINKNTALKLFGGYQVNSLRISMVKGFNTDQLQKSAEIILNDHYIGYADRSTLSAVSEPMDRFDQIKKLSIVFSSVFILLALLTMVTTMARLVESQQVQIGTLKAIGFGKGQIMFHYSLYSVMITLLGGIFAVILAPRTLSIILLKVNAANYSMPNWESALTPFSYLLILFVTICCTLATVITCQTRLSGMPAETMRGHAPKSGKKLFLERIPALWKRFSFEFVWTLRDISRNKLRAVMGIIGVLGCMILIMAGLGLQNTLNYANNYVYNKQYTFGTKALLLPNASDEDKKELVDSYPGEKQWIQESQMEIISNNKKDTGILSVVEEGSFVHLETLDGAMKELPEDGAFLTRKVADQIDVKEGDTISFRMVGDNEFVKVKVCEIVVPPLPQGIFISERAFENLGKVFQPMTVLFEEKSIKEQLENLPYIQEAASINELLDQADKFTNTIFIIFIMLIMAAIVLGVVILYNLGILSYTERTREYATLKVLGFYQKEISSFALRENIITTAIGWTVGIILGFQFLKFYISIVSVKNFDWIAKLSTPRFILATLITVGCSLCVSLFLSLKVKKINMVEALKTVE